MIMEPADWYIEGCLKYSVEEAAEFSRITGHLPHRVESTPYHSGAHSLRVFKNALRISGLKPGFKAIEVGFCLGHSAEILFSMGAGVVYSVENSSREETVRAIGIVSEKRGVQFRHLNNIPNTGGFNFAFIDGDHSEASIENDLNGIMALGVEWVLFDDWYPHWGDTQRVLMKRGITPVAILGTMALCHFPV